MSNDTEFRALIERVRTGDQGAATEFFETYGLPLLTIVRVQMSQELRGQMESRDVCQIVFQSFFHGVALGKYDFASPKDVIGLLTKVSQHRLIDQARRAKATRRDPGRIDDVDVEQIHGPTETPSKIVELRELIEIFRAKLSDEERALWEARRAGQSWDEIARGTGRTPDALRRQHDRALDRVADEIGLDRLPDG
jgi:RNA polymerase sigma factor (sigma-70 family)